MSGTHTTTFCGDSHFHEVASTLIFVFFFKQTLYSHSLSLTPFHFCSLKHNYILKL